MDTLPGTRFNHAIVELEVNGGQRWLESGRAGYSLNQLPSFDQGVQGLVLEPKRTASYFNSACDFGRSSPGANRWRSAGGRRLVLRPGSLASDRRPGVSLAIGINGTQGRRSRRVLRQYAGASFPSATIDRFSVEHLDDLSGDLTISHDVVIRRLGRRVGNLLLLSIPWLEAIRDNGFYAATSRTQPMFVPVHSTCDRQEIKLPPGFGGYGLPLQRAEECEWGRYRCQVRIQNGVLHCDRYFELRGGMVRPERFSEMARFTLACIEADASDIVLSSNRRWKWRRRYPGGC